MTKPDDIIPLKPELFQILLALVRQDLHGYGIVKAIEGATDGRIRLAPSLLYRRLRRLLEQGVVVEAIPPATEQSDDRRVVYRLTEFGRDVLRLEARRLRELADDVLVRQLAAEKTGSRDG